MIIDISMSLDENLVAYPGDEDFNHIWRQTYDSGIDYCVSSIAMSVHNGTHIDAPYHFNPHGLKIHEIEKQTLIGKSFVINIGEHSVIESHMIPDKINADKIIFKTSKKLNPDDPHNPHLSLQATVYLIDKGINLVGINQMSIEKNDTNKYPVHKLLSKNNIAILENLQLDNVDEGYYRLICAPLKIIGSEAAPCRVFLETL